MTSTTNTIAIDWGRLGGIELEILPEEERKAVVKEAAEALPILVCDEIGGVCPRCGEVLIKLSSISEYGRYVVKYCRNCRVKYVFDSVKCWERKQ